MSVDKLRLIEEVRKRPIIWDLRVLTKDRTPQKLCALWNEIGKTLNVDASKCRRTWKIMRGHFWNEERRIVKRIEDAKKSGLYDPRRQYYCWHLYDPLRFLANARYKRGKHIPNFEHSSDDNIAASNNTFGTQNDNNIGVAVSEDFHMNTNRQIYFGQRYEYGTDFELIENENRAQQRLGNCSENNFLPIENNTSPNISAHCYDGSNAERAKFLSYNISISNSVQDSECLTILNDQIAPPNYQEFTKEEPELQIDAETHCLENYTFNELREDSSATVSAVELSDDSEDSVLLVESNANEPGFNDVDYSFLYSFISHMNVMSKSEKIEFRANMKNLLLQISPASIFDSILEKQLLLSEDSDTDRKFLISFCPFMKSMSSKQNLQFRAKICNLVLQILAKNVL